MGFAADIDVDKMSIDGAYVPGGKVDYTITVVNKGPFGVLGVALSDKLPDGITQAAWTCSVNDIALAQCGKDSGSGAIDETINLSKDGVITYKVTAQVPPDFEGTLENTVTAQNPETAPDPVEENNTAIFEKNIARLEAEKTSEWVDEDGDDVPDEGERINYTIKVTNTGEVPVYNISLSDPGITLEGTLPDTLQPGDDASVPGFYLLTLADIESGAVALHAPPRRSKR